MRILLLGANGQVGWELSRSLAPLGELIAVDRRSDPRWDLADAEKVVGLARVLRPTVIVNAAAYTAVDRAEDDGRTAWLVNAEAPRALAAVAQSIGAMFVHFSTDYVFSGEGQSPWREDSPTGPANMYGRSKLAGEEGVRLACPRHLILRTSWVYASRGSNFLRRILSLASERQSLAVVDDQVGSPTGAELIADVTATAIRGAMLREVDDATYGTYHLAARGAVSWHGYAEHAIAYARKTVLDWDCRAEFVQAVSSAAFPAKARRPLNSRLDVSRIERVFGLTLPSWQPGVERAVSELMGN